MAKHATVLFGQLLSFGRAFAVTIAVLVVLTASEASARARCSAADTMSDSPDIVAGKPVGLDPTGETGWRGLPLKMLRIAPTPSPRGAEKPEWRIKVETAETSLPAFRAVYGDEILAVIKFGDSERMSTTVPVEKPGQICMALALIGIKLGDDAGIYTASGLHEQKLLPPAFVEVLAERLEQRAWSEIESRLKMAANGCRLPDVNGAQPVVVSSSGWPAVSSHDLTGSTGITSVADMTIEPGEGQLYIVASAEPIIWRVTGARERVAAFVLADSSGVAGLQAGLIHPVAKSCIFDFMQGYDHCNPLEKVYRTFHPEEKWTAVQSIALARKVQHGVLTRRYGAEPMLIDEAHPYPGSETGFYEDSIASISIPSGRHGTEKLLPGARAMSGEGDAGTLWRRFMGSHTGGVVEIDPATVISTRPLQRYAVLPEEGGYAQLIEQGAIEPIGWRDAHWLADGSFAIGKLDLKEGYFRVPFVFRVKKAIHMPVHPAIYALGSEPNQRFDFVFYF